MSEKGDLVYTTDKKDPRFAQNMVIYDDNVAQEANRERSDTIRTINKSIERRITMGKITGKEVSPATISLQRKIITLIFQNGPITRRDIALAVFGSDADNKQKQTFLSNVLQRIRVLSEEIIVIDANGKWCIMPGYSSGMNVLIDKVEHGVYSHYYRRNTKKATAPKPFSPPFAGDRVSTPLSKPTTIVVDKNKPIEIIIQRGDTNITIKIS